MSRSLRLTCVVASLALTLTFQSLALAQDEHIKERLNSSQRHHETAQIKTDAGRTVEAFVVYPEVDKPVAAVVIIHENRGLNDWARSLADQVAEAGYVAIAPDLLSGTGPDGGGTSSYESSDAAREGIGKLPAEQVLADLDAVVQFARDMKATSDTVAVAGFCWGGGKAFHFAAHNPSIAASFVFYGSAPDEATLAKLQVPVYGFYGGNDFRITGQVPEVKKTTDKLGKKFDPVTYDGAGHGFMRSGEGPDAKPADVEGREAAWKRWKGILANL